MDILINVSKQRLKLATNLKKYVSGSQEFVRFVFGLNSYWRDLLTFAQFAQNGNTYNRYLDDENAVYLPSEIVAGECTLTLFGSGNSVIATTNYLTLTIDENILVSDASSTDISESLYEQLVDMVRSVSNGTAVVDAKNKMIDKNKIYVYIGSETGMTNGNWYYWDGTAWTSGGVWNAVAVETDKTLSVENKAADGKAAGSLVEVGNTQPTSTANKIWIDPTDEEIEIPEMSDLNAVDAKVSNLKSDVDNLYANEAFEVIPNSYWPYDGASAGTPLNYSGWARTNRLPCKPGETLKISTTVSSDYNVFFNTNTDGDVNGHFYLSVGDNNIVVPQGAYYYALSNTTAGMANATIKKIINGTVVNNGINGINEIKGDINNINVRYINLFNPNTISEGKFLSGNGSLSINESFFASDYIDVSKYDTIVLSYTHIAHWYDVNKAHISAVDGMDTLNADATVTVPEGAYYLRFSTYNSNLELAQIGQNVSRDDYYAYKYYKLPYLVLDQNDERSTIIVDKSGNGDYTSFTEAVYQNVDSGKDIIVKPSIYDIVAEYVALFGQDVVDNLADSTSGINNFQYGIRIHDRKVIFESGSHLVCDWTGRTMNSTHRFCALRIEPGAELIGLDLDCTATFYCIHDDYGTVDDSPFTIKYENCRVIGHNLYNANCIGGGAHKYSRHVLKNCYFKNNVDSSDIVLSADVRYHNTNTADAEPELYVSNCYFSNNMNVTYYGTQTTKMRAYINNCFAPNGINKVRESSSMNVDNVDLYTWNNQPN